MRMTTRLIAMLLIVGGAAQAGVPTVQTKTIRGHEYILAWLQDGSANSYSAYASVSIIHSASCTNHAPTVAVVTQYVDRVVTQECRRQHCTNACLNCGTWRPNQWLGDGVIVTNDAGVEK